MKYPEYEYTQFDFDAGGKGDYDLRLHKAKIVKTRKKHTLF